MPLGDVGTEAGSDELAEYLQKQHGPIDYVVSSLGGWWQCAVAMRNGVSGSRGLGRYAGDELTCVLGQPKRDLPPRATGEGLQVGP